jgi:hypothetical protein
MRKNANDTDYQSKEHETVDRWTEDMLLDVIPENEESARKYLGAANYYDCSTEVKEHFANCIRRLQD